MFLPGGSHEDALQVYHSSFVFFSGGFNLSFVDHILSSFQMFSHAGAPLNHPILAIQLFRSAEDISEGSSFHSRSVQTYLEVVILLKPFNSTGAISLQIISTMFLLSGP